VAVEQEPTPTLSGRLYKRHSIETEARVIPDQEFEQLVRFLKVLADKSRLRILGLLAEREYTVKELASVLGLKEPTVSAHLNMLKWHDMVNMRQEGTAHYYSLRQDDVHRLLQELRPKAFKGDEEDTGGDEFERKVLQHFFVEGRLKEIPTRPNKQMVVLRRLAEEFAYDQSYPEKQVNEILKRFHPDCATLRRLLVDNRLMTRQNSIYQRLKTD